MVTGFTDDDNGTEKPTIAEARRKLPSLTRAPGMKASLTLTAGVMVFEQASGMTALLYYAGESLSRLRHDGSGAIKMTCDINISRTKAAKQCQELILRC